MYISTIIMFLNINHRPVLSKTPSCLYFKTQRFGGWILSQPSGWAQMSRFSLKTEKEYSLRNVVFLNVNRTMYNV
jgi:hypothetical protein